MCGRWRNGLALALGLLVSSARAQDNVWRPVDRNTTEARPATVRLGGPLPLTPAEESPAPSNPVRTVAATSDEGLLPPRFVRAQMADVPPIAAPIPPPPPPPPPPPGAAPVPPLPDSYACGQVTSKSGIADGNGFVGNAVRGVGGFFAPTEGRALFQSDHKFDQFITPVTDPFLTQDPRSLTQIRPIFIYDTVRHSNPNFNGGNAGYFGAAASVALTERLSLVMNKLGFVYTDPHDPTGTFHHETGFAEIWLGPQYTFIRNDCSNTLLAGGVTFQIPAGSSRVFQDTGSLTVAPYVTFGQNFLKSCYGSFNFMNTTGYALATDNQRSEYFYSTFHLDYDIANFHKFYPLIELNWLQYTRNGGARDIGYEGGSLINFGAEHIAGRSNLTLAFGGRVNPCPWLQFGAAVGWNLVDQQHNLNDFTFTFDVIFRY